MPPTPHSNTATVDAPWDAGAQTGKISNDAGKATLEKMYAYRDPNGDPNQKGSYSLPHHQVGADGQPGPANVNGVRNALARAGQVKGISADDQKTVRSNLGKHLFAHNQKNGPPKSQDDFGDVAIVDEDAGRLAGLVLVEGKDWAMYRRTLEAMCEYLAGKVVAYDSMALRASSGAENVNGVSVVKLAGVITPQPSMLSMLFGAGPGGLVGFLEGMRQAIGDPDTRAVVIDIDSPGGMVDQVPEAAAQLRAMRDGGGKPIVAVANTAADSAAYWLASQAHEIAVTPSGEVGSVGVYSVHRDASQMFDRVGIKHTMVSAGRYKGEGNPYEALGEEAHGAMKQAVDDHYEMFVSDVARGRGMDMPSAEALADGTAFGGGRTYSAKRAVNAGLADKVATLGETVQRLSTHRARVRQMQPAAYDKNKRLRLLDTLTSR